MESLKEILEEAVAHYNQPSFLEHDPIQIPHRFSSPQDQEIMGFWTATIAWGQRVSIIRSAEVLIELMDGAPYDFIKNHTEEDRSRFLNFKHRTFQATDTLYFLEFLQQHYRRESSLEAAFLKGDPGDPSTESALRNFHEYFFSFENAPARTRKHVATPARKSTCKRLNMFLRWMVRSDAQGVDLGLWKGIKPAQLLIPLDVHVDRVARSLGLIARKQTDWLTVLELTATLRELDPMDPVRYDYALFGMGVHG